MMKTVGEIKNVYLEKVGEIAKNSGGKQGLSYQSITTKHFICRFGNLDNLRVLSTYIHGSDYKGYPFVELSIETNYFGYKKNEWTKIDKIDEKYHEEIKSYVRIMRDYWNHYLAFKEKPNALFLVEPSHYNKTMLLKSALESDYILEDIQPIHHFLNKIKKDLVGQIPEDIVKEGINYRCSQLVVNEFLKKQQLISLYSPLKLLVNSMTFDLAGLFFTLGFTKNYDKIWVSYNDHTDELAADINEVMQYFNELIEQNKAVHLFNPPNKHFKKLIENLVQDIEQVSEENLNEQYSILEDILGSWKEVELLCGELTKIVDNYKDEEVYRLFDYLKKQGITIDRMHYKDLYYFIVTHEFNSGKRRKEIEIFVSIEEKPTKINELARDFVEKTLH